MEMKKLTDVSPARSLFLNETETTNYVFQPESSSIDPEMNYDALLVLGCSIRDVLVSRTEEAIRLYYRGMFSKIILSGGVGFLSKYRNESEASVMKKIMLKYDIPERDILLEDKSSDTLQNMKNSLMYIKKECGQNGKLAIVTSDFHTQRAIGLLQVLTENMDLPILLSYHSSLDGVYDMDKWYLSKAGRSMMRTERLMTSIYAKNGKIPDYTISSLDTYQRIR